MGRLPKWRRVASIPQVTYFKPAGIPARVLEEIRLSVEEAEAIRLKDLEGLEQEDCAQRMHISRPTFHRVLGSARRKVADALLGGRALRIEGGRFEMASCRFRCIRGHEWEVPFEAMTGVPPGTCPSCHSESITPVPPLGRCRRRGGRR